MHNIRIYRGMERTIAKSPEVQGILNRHARTLGSAARARLARHRETGEHQIELSKGRIDHYVNLVGESALSVEMGHHNKRSGKFVPGLRILRGVLE